MNANNATPVPIAPMFRLDGKRALVTGAGRGIGLASAAALAQAGAHVTLVARSAAEIGRAADALKAAGGSADAMVLDVTDVPAAAAFVAERPPFDILVNNAGTNRPKHFLEVTTGEYDEVASLNVRAVLFLSQAVAQRLVAHRRPGSIIHMSSQMGHRGGPNRTVYCATKHAIEGLTKAMAIDLGPHGIRVNSIGPTFIETTLSGPFLQDEAFLAKVMGRLAVVRVGQVEDLMGAVVFLASDAAAMITGSALMVDGGWTAG